MSIFKTALRWTLTSVLTRAQRRKLGSFVLNEAVGDNDGDSTTNGEYALLQRVFQRPGTTPRIVFDVGANVGSWSRECLKLAAASDRLFAFEPSQKTFERLRANLAGDARATCVNTALSDHDGETRLNLAGEACGTNSIHRREFRDDQDAPVVAGSETIRLQTGDSFCAQQGIEKIDFVKIDTEGHELSVLNGFNRMLSERRIRMLQFEYGGTWLDARIQLADAFEVLQKHGYLIAKIFPAGLQFYERYEQRFDTFQHANFAALLPELKRDFNAIK